MNEDTKNSTLSESNSENTDERNVTTVVPVPTSVARFGNQPQDGEQPTLQSTYERFSTFFSYFKKFMTRLGKDVYLSARGYFYPGQELPNHISDLMRVQEQLSMERHARSVTLVISEESLEALIPSYPGSPRSLLYLSATSSSSTSQEGDTTVANVLEILHTDNELLVAAESGNARLIKLMIMSNKNINVNVKDHLGRNALHLAVTTDSEEAVISLLEAGVDATVKDHLGRTPLFLCLMRRPSLKIAHLLFSHGASIVPRASPMDTGIFIQFVMVCTPTEEEEQILHLLAEKGAKVNDPGAPGQRQPLHFAAMSNNCKLIQVLINLGANPYAKNHRGETPREVALNFRCTEAADLLADIEKETIYGN